MFIAAMLLIQESISWGAFLSSIRSLTSSSAAHILSDKEIPVAGRVTSGPTIARYLRIRGEAKIIDDIGIHLDPKRLFDEADKKLIYSRDQGKLRYLQGIC